MQHRWFLNGRDKQTFQRHYALQHCKLWQLYFPLILCELNLYYSLMLSKFPFKFRFETLIHSITTTFQILIHSLIGTKKGTFCTITVDFVKGSIYWKTSLYEFLVGRIHTFYGSFILDRIPFNFMNEIIVNEIFHNKNSTIHAKMLIIMKNTAQTSKL